MIDNDPISQIEDIVLQDDIRGMTALKPHMPQNYVARCADLLLDHPGKIFIVTGFYIMAAEATETDGPPGAVTLGNALTKLGNEIAYVTDELSSEVVRSIAEHEVIEFPITNHFESANFANELFQEHSPSALIAIERAGLVGDGTYRNFRGVDFTPYNAKIDHLFDQHPYSVGIGDGGNEIGMGNLQNVIPTIEHEYLPKNPCVTTTTELIIASCSNWGGYGLVAALSLKHGINLLPSVEEAKQMVREIVAVGAVEGMSGESKEFVDGRDLEGDSVCISDLHVLLAEQGIG
ncbi:MAG: DUF4392 domain-containing protein [Chloroflexi bacterium]|nr:DUF4392 domain-containing protein [Chloroflexota bacterium]